MTDTMIQTFNQSFQNKIDLYEEEVVDPNDDWDDYPYFDEVRSLKKKQQKLNIDKQLFAIFWMLELPDLMVPEHMYEDLLKRKLSELELQK